nr:NapC/NirT family cytochrome c [uncultured Rhodopila sp.]
MSAPSPPPGRWSWLTGNVWFRTATRPSVHFSLLFLTLGGFVAGVAFWGGFNTAMEAANTESFCISCHEMRDNVYQELQGTIHWTNRSGVRATCPDCHTPHPWTLKIARKMQASKEVWAKLFGAIDTRRKFLDQRTLMAQREWARMTANNSAECRNCHSAQSMDLSRQQPRAAAVHQARLLTGERTCIDCHKGIAHLLPKPPKTDEIEGFDDDESAPPMPELTGP